MLPSWRDTATTAAITGFLARVTDPDGPDHVPPAERVAVLDNDGTLWSEKPMPIQLDFTLRRLAALADGDPSLRGEQPYRAAHEHDTAWMAAAITKHYRGDDADLGLLEKAVTTAFDAVGVEEYGRDVRGFFADAVHPTLGRAYRDCGFVPMIELLDLLRRSGFTVYIASAGDRDFMRPVAEDLYGVPPEGVIGSALGLTYDRDGRRLAYTAAMEFFDDGPEKPVRIWSRVGRRPILAVGNSDGDLPMLDFAEAPGRPALRVLVRHDDADREFAYSAGAEVALARAAADGWTVVSMRHDWHTVFPAPS